ncbi:MAG: helix-turn-helix transcriptional regulator [Dorea sp.]|uniref:helix-turn-helix domain-containing protein n=1 Tax=Sporofaciens musculi TaxID=2681861 RepID=UPI00216C3D37|nr:helix-turn-helix transcriptional regulator [Sporofaciens musculi]MCI9423214.1 helix-turn-helix transcriptional regulator [Dorea sp.]
MALGENIRKLREKANLTQQQLAERLYVSRQTVSRWESGVRCPDLITAKKLAMELDISLDELISDEEVKNIPENMYFWRGPEWEKKRKLKEYKKGLYRLLDVVSSIFLVFMIFQMKTKVPIWCTLMVGGIVGVIWLLIFAVDRKMGE